MAHVAGYDCDIFISFSRRDNEPIGNRKGWVDIFQESLENWLAKRRGLERLSIWRDFELGGNTDFDEAIQNRLRNSALFFVLNSRNYLRSDYCRKELEWFHRFHGGPAGRLSVGEERRIFNILLNNLPHQEWPDELQGAVGFPMHDAKGVELGEFTDPADDAFTRQLRFVVDAVERTLGHFAIRAPSDSRTSERPEPHRKIFVSEVPDPLLSCRDRLVSDLKTRGLQVVDDVPPPMEDTLHSARVRDILDQVDLTVHLFDQWPGRRIVDRRETTYSRVQMELALQSAVPTIVWTPSDLDLTKIEDENHRRFLDRLENSSREKSSYEFVRGSSVDLLSIILDTVAVRPSARNGDHQTQFLLDSHQKDQRFLYRVADLLADKGADVEINKESSDPVRSLENFERAIRHARNLVIMFGQVTPTWLQGRVRKAAKILAEQFEAGQKPLEGVWVFRLPGCMASVELPRMALRIEVLDNGPFPSIEPELLRPLFASLDRESHA